MDARTILGFVLCLLLTGCLVSKNPLSDPQTSKPDERLVGVWRLSDEHGRFTNYHVGHAGEKFPNSMMRVAFVQHAKGEPDSSGEFLMFPSVLADKNYLNVIAATGQRDTVSEEKGWNADAVDCYWLFKYQVDGDKLVMWGTDEKAKRQAINGGKIKGVIENCKPAKLTDTTENVACFVAGKGDGLFSIEPFRLEKVGSGVRTSEKPLSQSRSERRLSPFIERLGEQATPTPPLRPLGRNLMVDENSIIWSGDTPVGIWGVEGGEMLPLKSRNGIIRWQQAPVGGKCIDWGESEPTQ